ncbi:bacteriocin biosynthesis protein [Streptomyces sp. Ru73]|uniref:thiopeptide-type bacteriocin biosynthesis protein n=1 Tax=Streptomyces sp. Ru73 TaxID=2080748 RepID=UPI000CDD2ECD|nr:thiopeptide-type bacteriocin biosynthesis protein [Streptomyces sp. Ru73]POX43362.1 bacteriocin biosynthesis protein [Streptomyces sp. Ru73]
MPPHDTNQAEDAVLAVLRGATIEDAARSAGTSPARLAESIERYRAAGRAALDVRSVGWHQLNIQFTDYSTAERTFRSCLVPALRNGSVGSWWFVRKYPCWRLRLCPSPQAPQEDAIAPITEALEGSVARGAVAAWRRFPYEPETVAFGGPAGMKIAHELFHTDSIGVLDYLHVAGDSREVLLDAKATSLLAMTLLMRAAGLELGEQGDVWGQVEEHRPLAEGVPPDRVSSMAGVLRRLLLIDVQPLLADGALTPVRDWFQGLEQGGLALADAWNNGRLALGMRGVLARHVLFHWNRMGFTLRQQSIWSRAAREAILGR